MTLPDDRVALDWLILSDGAQVVGGKLYLLGGGWDVLTVNSGFPVQQHLAIAAAFRVPWTQTNQKHSVEIRLLNDDSQEVLATIAGEFEVGRPPGIPPGSAQRSQLAAQLVVAFAQPGPYAIRCAIGGEEQVTSHVSFRVVAGPLARASGT